LESGLISRVVLELLGAVSKPYGKAVLEFGCSVG
jgi:hypothetical protein